MDNSAAGRPHGTYAKDKHDKAVLTKVAKMLISLKSNNATTAIREIIGDDRKSDLRRLQRRWSRESQEFIRIAQEPFFRERWNLEAQALKQRSPELYATYKKFSESPGGKKLLLEKGTGTRPVHFMSLGPRRLSQIIETHKPHGGEKAQREFKNSLSEWRNYGFEPDSTFLKTFGELCLKQADEVDSKTRGEGQ